MKRLRNHHLQGLFFKCRRTYANTVQLTIDGYQVQVPENTTILDACKLANKQPNISIPKIPTLCYTPFTKQNNDLHAAVCRICLVQDTKSNKLIPACVTPVQNGMVLETNNTIVRDSVKSVLKFILARHPLECPTCDANRNCELQDLMEEYHVTPQDVPKSVAEQHQTKHEMHDLYSDDTMRHFEKFLNSQSLSSTHAIKIDMDKCIRCGRCVKMCQNVQGLGLLSLVGRGQLSHIHLGQPRSAELTHEEQIINEKCISCGQCSAICPVGAITMQSQVDTVYDLLQEAKSKDHKKLIVCQIAPSVRVAISEEFGHMPGFYSLEQLVGGLRAMGFHKVFDALFTADLTIMEEGMELLERVKNGGPFPMFTSCCPGWINLVEKYYPEYIPNLSSCRSPQGMMSSLLKNYWAEKMGYKKEDVIVVSIMPCTAKKDEAKRPQLKGETDYVLTTRELGQLFHRMNIRQLNNMALYEKMDSVLDAQGSGAGDLFGVTGGVMEAALRTVYEVVYKAPMPKIEFEQVRGVNVGIKRAELPLPNGQAVKLAVAHGTANTRQLMEKIKSGEEAPHFVEIMACTGGCIGGGGQPKTARMFNMTHLELLQARAQATYSIDERKAVRKSHENKQIQQLYQEFLGAPLSHIAHDLLHTYYAPADSKINPEEYHKQHDAHSNHHKE